MGNLLIDSLVAISNENFLSEKILICPNFDIGYQILENLTRSGNNWVNYKVKTIQSLAEDIAEEEIYKRNLKKISLLEINFLVDHIFTKLSEDNFLKYFEKHIINTGIINLISSNLLELKFAGISYPQLKDNYFINKNKANDLKLIYKSYEESLKEKYLIDSAGIINLALSRILSPDSQKIYIALAKYNYKKIEKDFLSLYCGDNLLIIGEEKVFNLKRPINRLSHSNILNSNNASVKKFSFLFDLNNLPAETEDKTSLELFSSQNYKNEIYEILNKLVGDKTAIDDTEIIYTNPEPYLGIIYNLTAKLDIAVTFSSGLPGDRSAAGKALKGFLLWIKEDFLEIHLRNLFKYNLLKINKLNIDSKITGYKLANVLRESKIGWRRDRYIKILDKSIAEHKTKSENFKGEKQYYEDKIDLISNLKSIVSKLLNIVPDINSGKVNLGQLCSCCLKFVSDFIKAKNEDEASYLSNLKENLETMQFVADNSVSLEEAVQKITELLIKVRFLKSGPKPGHLFISDLANGGISGRSNTYIVGMDDHKFPGTEFQDPILLDEEREKISKDLQLSRGRLKERLYDFTSMLAGVNSKVCFSYSVFDIKGERRLFPSSVLLQLYRLNIGKTTADYNDLLIHLEQASCYVQKLKNNTFVDENYWWLNQLFSEDRLKDARPSVLNIYPWLKEGSLALNSRSGSSLTVYDGWLGSKFNELDPRKNKDFILSCTGIEMYARSPYEFFLRQILKIKRPDEIKKDLTLWLDPGTRGSLLHEVFQVFIKELISMENYPDIETQRKSINKILDDKIEKYKTEIPFPSKAVLKQEINSLKRDVSVFIDENAKLGNPVLIEFEFGYNDQEPIRISLGDGVYIYVAGRVDRVDMDLEETDTYHVWDYKTGSSSGYEEEGYVNKGKQFQHVLYAKAIEEILKIKNLGCKVSKCGYIFPTQRGRDSGKGCVLARDPFKEDKWLEALNCILDLIANGVFIYSDEENTFFVDDEDIYGTKTDKKNIKQKLNDPENVILEKFKTLREFK